MEMRAVSQIRWVIVLLGFMSWGAPARAQDVVIVANKALQISTITDADLRAIFTGAKTRFADGSHAVPVILNGGAVHEVFLKKHVGQNAEDFRAQWRKKVFTGEGAMPKSFDSEAALLEYVAATPGAVGYVSRPPEQDNVKQLVVVDVFKRKP
jgi:ABC-type phosphate transport system substrate-binding protein